MSILLLVIWEENGAKKCSNLWGGSTKGMVASRTLAICVCRRNFPQNSSLYLVWDKHTYLVAEI
jgi:hypothetical protein